MRSSEQEEGKMLWAPEKPSFWRRRDLSKDFKHEYRLGKEASMREESGGYESLDEFAKGVGWRKGPLVLDLVFQFLTLCVDAPLLQRSLFPRNRSPGLHGKAETPSGPLALLLWGLRGSARAPEGSGTRHHFPNHAGAYGFTSNPAWGSERLNATARACACCAGYRVRTAGPLLPSLPPCPTSGLRKGVRVPRSCCSSGWPPVGGQEAAATLFPALRRAVPVRSPLSPRSRPKPTPRLAPSHILLPRQGLEWVRSPSHVAPLPALGQSGGFGRRGFQGSPRTYRAVGRGALGTGAGRTHRATGVRRGTRTWREEKQTLVRKNPGRT